VTLAALLAFAVLFAVPYLAARALWLVRMPAAIRVVAVLAVPGLLIGWLGTSPDFRDVTSPGAFLIPLAMLAGWLCGASARCRRLYAGWF